MIIGAISGVLVVFAVIFIDRIRIDDPVGAIAVHLINGTLGTLYVGLFAQDKIAGFASGNGLFNGGGFSLLGKQALGVLCVGVFVFSASVVVWLAIKKTIGLRVPLKEEIQGLDVNEHGNQAYPEYLIHRPSYTSIMNDFQMGVDVDDNPEVEKGDWL